jgi:hypothetical protein
MHKAAHRAPALRKSVVVDVVKRFATRRPRPALAPAPFYSFYKKNTIICRFYTPKRTNEPSEPLGVDEQLAEASTNFSFLAVPCLPFSFSERLFSSPLSSKNYKFIIWRTEYPWKQRLKRVGRTWPINEATSYFIFPCNSLRLPQGSSITTFPPSFSRIYH